MSQLSIDLQDKNMKNVRAKYLVARNLSTITRFFFFFDCVSFAFYDLDLSPLHASLSLSLFFSLPFFFLFARCTSLRATKGEYTPTQFHLTQDSNLVVYFANLLTSFGFDGVPLFATFVSIPTITCRWTCKGMFD